jgi:hypothetical protein
MRKVLHGGEHQVPRYCLQVDAALCVQCGRTWMMAALLTWCELRCTCCFAACCRWMEEYARRLDDGWYGGCESDSSVKGPLEDAGDHLPHEAGS